MDITIKYMLRPVALLAGRVAVLSPGQDVKLPVPSFIDFILERE